MAAKNLPSGLIVRGATFYKTGENRGRRNQDDFETIEHPQYLAAIVSDGCGSKKRSDVGAALTVQFIKSYIQSKVEPVLLSGELRSQFDAALRLEKMMGDMFNALSKYFNDVASLSISHSVKGEIRDNLTDDFIDRNFMATYVVALVFYIGEQLYVLTTSMGDGVIVDDGSVHDLGWSENSGVCYPGLKSFSANRGYTSISLYPTTTLFPLVSSIVVATDGVLHLDGASTLNSITCLFDDDKDVITNTVLFDHVQTYGLRFQDDFTLCVIGQVEEEQE